MAANAAIVLQNPSDNDVITLRPGQYAVLRFPIPFWELKNDVDYFWCVNPIQVKEQQFFIREMRLVRDGKRIWQEVIVMLCPSRCPKEMGCHFLGGIRAQNRKNYLFIIFELNVERSDFQGCNPEYSKALRELMDAYKVVRERRKVEEKKQEEDKLPKGTGTITYLVRDPWPEDRIAKISRLDTLKVVLNKRLISYSSPTGASTSDLLDWHLSGLPKWLDIHETMDQNRENVFVFKVDRKALASPTEELKFKCGESVRKFKVQLEPDAATVASWGS